MVPSMLRSARAADAHEISEIYNHYVEHTTVTFEEVPVSSTDMERRIATTIECLPWLVFEQDGRVDGYAYASRWKGRCAYRFSVESTVYLRQDTRGRGIGTALYSRLISELRDQDFHAAIGGVSLPNPASERLHEKLGFTKVAHFPEVGFKFGKWIDVAYWQLVLSPR